MINVLHVFPLIGGGVLGTDWLKFNGEAIDNLETAFSLSGAKANEAAVRNNTTIDIKYWDEEFSNVDCDCVTCNPDKKDYNAECNRIDACLAKHQTVISKADIILSIPPCNALSALNASNESRSGKDNPMSQIMIRCVEFALKSGVPCFIFENAPALSSKTGFPLLEQIAAKIENHFPYYSMNVVKTNSLYHGTGQKRSRTFVYLWKTDGAPLLDFDLEISDLSEVLGDISFDGSTYTSKPQNKKQEFLRGCSLGLDVSFAKDEKLYERWSSIFKVIPPEKFSSKVRGGFFKSLSTDDLEDLIKLIECDLDLTKELKMVRHIHTKVNMDKNYWSYTPLFTEDKKLGIKCTDSIIGKNMGRIFHPEYPRCLTVREECRMMGIPDDYEIDNKSYNMIGQNVPAFTFAAQIKQLIKFLSVGYKTTEYRYLFTFINENKVTHYSGNNILAAMNKKKEYKENLHNKIKEL
jgi:site-specific DNA-cytosine methylase